MSLVECVKPVLFEQKPKDMKETACNKLAEIAPFWANMLRQYDWDDDLTSKIQFKIFDADGNALKAPNGTTIEYSERALNLYTKGRVFALMNSNCCIVGEAYNQDNSFINNCPSCMTFSYKFAVSGDNPPTKLDWATRIIQFVDHVKEEHPKIMEKTCPQPN